MQGGEPGSWALSEGGPESDEMRDRLVGIPC